MAQISHVVRSRTWRVVVVVLLMAQALTFFSAVPSRADTPPSSSIYNGQNVQAAALVAALSPIPCAGGETVLLIQDNVPWYAAPNQSPLGSDVNELEAEGAHFCMITSNEISTTSLTQFSEILIAAAQTQAFYDNLFPGGAVAPSLAAYVQQGGILSANLTDYASGPGNGGAWTGAFVGGLTHILNYSNNDNIADTVSPLITGQFGGANGGQIVDTGTYTDLDGWNYSSHGYFTNLPANTKTILVDESNRPVTVEYPFGAGKVIATLTTTEWRYAGGLYDSMPQNLKLLANELGYQRSLSLPPGGEWITPANNFTTSGDTLKLAVHAYPSAPGGAPIAGVAFTAWWPGIDPNHWHNVCTVSNPLPGTDQYECSLDLSDVVPGPLMVSFDVTNTAGKTAYAPNGVHNGTVPSTSYFKFPWDAATIFKFTGGLHRWTGPTPAGLDFSNCTSSNASCLQSPTPILAMAAGQIVYAGSAHVCLEEGSTTFVDCNILVIRHSGALSGYSTSYVHLDSFAPGINCHGPCPIAGPKSIQVAQGQWIGNEGMSGAKYVHIHIDLVKSTTDITPANWQEVSWNSITGGIQGWHFYSVCTPGYLQGGKLAAFDEISEKQQTQGCASGNYNGYMTQGILSAVPEQGGLPHYWVHSTNENIGVPAG